MISIHVGASLEIVRIMFLINGWLGQTTLCGAHYLYVGYFCHDIGYLHYLGSLCAGIGA